MKLLLILSLHVLLFSGSCFSQNYYTYTRKLNYDLSNKPDSVREYFDDVCSFTKKSTVFRYARWEEDVYILLCIEDSINKDSITLHVKNLLSELNEIINPINIYLTNDTNKMTTFGVIGSFDYFNEMSVKFNQKLKLEDDGYTGGVNRNIHSLENIWYSYFFINHPKCNNYGNRFVKHVITEELVQALGFPHDSWKYESSIFYDGFDRFNCPTGLSELDKELISILYNESLDTEITEP
jgi:hypothetical protein